jgi:AraC-like DNA-binding protein
VAHVSAAHFSRSFREVFGETPHRYLQRRRVERSMFLLREPDRRVTDICFDVGFTSLGTFSRTFREIVGESPSDYRHGHGPIVAPHCVQLAAMRPREAAGESKRPSSFGEAVPAPAP